MTPTYSHILSYTTVSKTIKKLLSKSLMTSNCVTQSPKVVGLKDNSHWVVMGSSLFEPKAYTQCENEHISSVLIKL